MYITENNLEKSCGYKILNKNSGYNGYIEPVIFEGENTTAVYPRISSEKIK
jgi:hypothetical protein